MTQVDLLFERLKREGLQLRGISLGSNPNVTAEQVAAEIHKALDQIKAGDFETVCID